MAGTAPHRLRDGPTDAMAPKARALAILAAAGVATPEGWVLWPSRHVGPASLGGSRAAVRDLLVQGPIAVRSAADDEDGVEHSGAGMGTSVLGVTSEAAAALALSTVARDGQAIVQHQVTGRWLIVAAVTEHGDEIEAHDATAGLDADALAGNATPAWSGRLTRWDDRAAPAVQAAIRSACDAARGAGLRSNHGWDLELVVAPDDQVWVVQLRPLAAALHGDWLAFASAVADTQGRKTADFGPHVLTLDAEHNPAPLSVAHTWVMEQLERDRGAAAGSPCVLAGWLYLATLPRDLAARSPRERSTVLGAREALALLVDRLLPRARARLEAVARACAAPPTAAGVDAVLQSAWSAFLAMIDVYVGQLVPARARAGTPMPSPDRDDPITLRERAQYLDVLPAAWDIASPTLAELGVTLPRAPHGRPQLPTDDALAATVLSEWDDHLFALGLAPLRRVYQWVGAATTLGDDVFFLRGHELAAAATGSWPPLGPRRSALQRHLSLMPPQRIDDGHPVAAGASGPMRGIGVGPPFCGPSAVRRDLQALLRHPPAAGSVVMMPALTAPAAVALRHAGITAVCSEHGGPLSHATLMARELGLSALIGCRGCTSVPDGTAVTVDTRAGRLRTSGKTPRA